jgi:molecular chaperone HtpG
LIVQIDVGFFSAFFGFRKSCCHIKHNDDDQYIWKNEEDKRFTIRKDRSGGDLIREIKVTIYLKENLVEFFEEKKIKDLIKNIQNLLDI